MKRKFETKSKNRKDIEIEELINFEKLTRFSKYTSLI